MSQSQSTHDCSDANACLSDATSAAGVDKCVQSYFTELHKRFVRAREIERSEAPDFCLCSELSPAENNLSYLIRTLLDPTGSHGHGHLFLDSFLEILQQMHPELPAAKTIADLRQKWDSASNIKAAVEQSTNRINDTGKRMDIVVRGKGYALMIENKPWADDQPKQLLDYSLHLENETSGRYLMIYLSGDGKIPSESSISSEHKKKLEEEGKLLIVGYRPFLTKWLESCEVSVEANRVKWAILDLSAYVEKCF